MATLACLGTRAIAASTPAPDIAGVRAIGWSGRTRTQVDGRWRDLIVDTRIEPFRWARTRSWQAGERSATARTLILEPTGQWLVRGGTRLPLPAAIGRHERQLHALYAYLLVVQQPARPAGPVRLHVPPAPPILFVLGRDGLPQSADYRVAAPEPGGPAIDQRVTFGNWMTAQDIRWPRRIAIARGGKPYFTLDIDRLSVERS